VAVVQFGPTVALTGYIRKTGTSTYDVYTSANPQTGKVVAPTYPTSEARGFLSYDTSSLPDTATVSAVRLYVDVYANSAGGSNPDDWVNGFYMGTWVSGTLDSSDWAGGSYAGVIDWSTNPADAWVAMASSANSLINLTGVTDVKVVDFSNFTAGNGDWYTAWNKTKTKLEVTYTIPAATRRIFVIS